MSDKNDGKHMIILTEHIASRMARQVMAFAMNLCLPKFKQAKWTEEATDGNVYSHPQLVPNIQIHKVKNKVAPQRSNQYVYIHLSI